MTQRPEVLARLIALVWPVAFVSGLLLVAFAQVRWGVSDEGVRPSITGLGRVSVPGATDEDVDYFFDGQTRRPGLVVVVAGSAIAAAALVGWWKRPARPVAMAVIGIGAVTALVVGIRTVRDPAAHLFSDRLTQALDLDLPDIQPGYGLVGVVGVAGVLLAVVAFWLVTTWTVGRGAAGRRVGEGPDGVQANPTISRTDGPS
ncbi:hypothetical protein QSJ18_05545 [Gordonia sp. ABSL1-1]|uniref:hypothetical protein n=1 Tax=Gordonia sp. ABSL1-1 TaxID=3053923 RepID=UPI002572F15A|nr:hypothetical protein [Gordonia sp. ABSL1-1]MDL9936199.1 hypothetical protein [Gordonia sp. ABSL1-1]